ncbi:MAG TPA: hypothetical protein DD706_07640 [Nitrospiraceae bacterium]|nr:hypothetical protein [Nitrospiraceae bacterium]
MQIRVRMAIFPSGDQYFASFIAWPFPQSPIIFGMGHAFKETRTPCPPPSLFTGKSGDFSSKPLSLYAMAMKNSYDQHLISCSLNQVRPIALTPPLTRLVNESDTVRKA